MNKKISITHIKNNHSDWLRALEFYKQELGILRGRLTEIAGKNTGDETMKQVEHFENQFKVQVDNIDRLNHEIRLHTSQASEQLQESKAGYIDAAIADQHNLLETNFASEEKTIKELRHDFNRFAAEWM